MPIRSHDLRALVNLKDLQSLYLSNTEIDDDAAQYIKKLHSLKHLSVEGAKIGDQFIADIASLKHLDSLEVSGTRITNASVDLVRAFPRLTYFGSMETELDEEAIEQVERVIAANYDVLLEELD